MTKEVTSHYDGHRLTERLTVTAEDEVGPGEAHHLYVFGHVLEEGVEIEVGRLQFQRGAVDKEGSTPGVLTVAVLAALIDQLEDFQAGPYPSEEGACALSCLNVAMSMLRIRANKRAERGVLGKNQA